MKKIDPVFIALLITLSGYGAPAAATPPDSIATAAAQPAIDTPSANPGILRGEIIETMNAAGYTYLLLDTGSEQVWAATNVTEVTTGQRVSVPAGDEMANFHSKALDRTFDKIYFVSGIYPEGTLEKAAEQGHGMAGGSRTAVADAHVEDVAKAPGGYTVEEILEQRSTLGGNTVKVHGRVVKFTPDIMGTNWMHIQDGTTGDLAVTTDALANTGDVVMVEGILSVDKDFGAGYMYPAIIEQATVTRD
ncbi:MAG TPA: DNA-binding protein [Gammaproteobacteria bacterium]|nr:DNA-binding protein [Gammaproteobacteria bacterium]